MQELTSPQPSEPRSRAVRFDADVPAPAPSPARLLTAAAVIATLLLAMLGGLVAFGFFAHEDFVVGPAHLTVSAKPFAEAGTVLSVPPFGAVTARTHAAPIQVTASLDEVDLTRLQTLAVAGVPGPKEVDGYKAAAQQGAMRAIGKGLMAALVAAAFLGWAMRGSWRTTLAAGLLGLVLPALLMAWTVRGYDVQAFRTPSYEGAMKYAPSLMGLVQTRLMRVDDLRAQIGDTVRELASYYARPQSFTVGGTMPGTIRVLQVSDLHLDPVGFKLESDLADEYKVSLIVDAGDLETFGTPVEAAVIQRYLDTRYPRILVAGNHESPVVVRAASALPNVTVLDDATATVDGITVYGLADPMSRKDGWIPDEQVAASEASAAAAKLRARETSGMVPPQIVATHEPVAVARFAGLAPLLVAGHTHTQDLGKFGPSWYVNSGTVGGVNFSKFVRDPHIPHGASILYYTSSLPRRLVAIDQIQVWGSADQTSLKRTVVDPKLLAQVTTKAKRPEAATSAASTRAKKPAAKPKP